MNALALLQWPALVITVTAAWLVSIDSRVRRKRGFLLYLISNILWVVWGMQAEAYALIVLQIFLFVSNIHGIIKNSR